MIDPGVGGLLPTFSKSAWVFVPGDRIKMNLAVSHSDVDWAPHTNRVKSARKEISMPTDAERIGLWRYGIIAPIVDRTGAFGTLKDDLKRLSHVPREHPTRGIIFVQPGTLEGWVYAYRKNGFDGLLPLTRKDHGKSRVIDDELAEEIESLVEKISDIDGPGIIEKLQGRGAPPSLSTLYRFLTARGLDQRNAPNHRDHRAYAFDLSGDCWQSDVMFGPTIPTRSGQRRKTYLIGIIDDASRVVPHAEFYFEQDLRPLKDCLKQALLKRGVPRRLYMDNGKIFRSRMILGLAARLGIQIIHSRPYRPQGRAKIERWFRTVRMTFLRRIGIQSIEGIDELNRLFLSWVEGTYHVHPHRGLEGKTPLDCWTELSGGIRPLPRDVDLDRLFLEEVRRKVHKDGTIHLKSRRFEVGPELIGQSVTVLFDSFDLRSVLVVDQRKKEHQAWPVDLRGNRDAHRRGNTEGDDDGN